MQYNDPNGDLNITDNVKIPKNLYLSSGTALSKPVVALSVVSYAGDIGAGAASPLLTIPANAAPNFILVTCGAYMGVRTGESAQVDAIRNVMLNATVLGTLRVSTIAAGEGDDVLCAATVGYTQHLVAGVGYTSTVANTINLAALSYTGTLTADAQHRITVLMG
jgi:hypothetical protein